MRIATLISWVLTASLGGYMLRTWLAGGGLRRERSRAGGLPPQLIFGHMGLALTGLGLWIGFTGSGAKVLCWAAVGILTGVISLGICTVTLWTPYPARNPGLFVSDTVPPSSAGSAPPASSGSATDTSGFTVTDEMIQEFLADPFPVSRGSRSHLATLVPVMHGIGALTTFLLAVMTASGA